MTKTIDMREPISLEDLEKAPAFTNTVIYMRQQDWDDILAWQEEEDMTTDKNEGMEKRGVVNTEKEKTAHEKISKQVGTVTGRMPTDKPNQANTPKKGE